MWHEIFAGSNFHEFRGFSNNPRKDPVKIDPSEKNYSRTFTLSGGHYLNPII